MKNNNHNNKDNSDNRNNKDSSGTDRNRNLIGGYKNQDCTRDNNDSKDICASDGNESVKDGDGKVVDGKKYDFFALIARMKYIKRWSLMHSVEDENVMEHSEQVAVLAHALAVIKNKLYGGALDEKKVLLLALYHETGEVFTGDLPTPVKYFNSQINSAYKDLEARACRRILETLPQELREDFRIFVEADTSSDEYAEVKRADKLAAYIKCITEIKLGNSEFTKAKTALEADLAQRDAPELRYFMEKFAPSFSKTLDELEFGN